MAASLTPSRMKIDPITRLEPDLGSPNSTEYVSSTDISEGSSPPPDGTAADPSVCVRAILMTEIALLPLTVVSGPWTDCTIDLTASSGLSPASLLTSHSQPYRVRKLSIASSTSGLTRRDGSP